MSKNRRAKYAVSEVLGTILLLVISVTLFSVVYVALFSVQVEPPSPSVNIVGTIDGNNLILENRGGESLSLDTEIILGSGSGSTERISINDYLSDEYKTNEKWDIGERIVYQLNNLNNFSRFDPLDVSVVDFDTNSIVMMGTVKEARMADIKVEMSVSDYQPLINSVITIVITATNENGPSNATNVSIGYFLPSAITYLNHVASQGNYDNDAGIWDVGDINVGNYTTLTITARISAFGYNQTTQFVVLLDGSGSIDTNSWKLACDGLANAIGNVSVFPRDGSVELTIIQFGINNVCARVEVGPVVVYENNYNNIKNQIIVLKNKQGKGWTPVAAAFYLGNDIVANSNNFGGFNPNYKQVILLVTDGNANVKSNTGEYCGTNAGNYNLGKTSAANARNYLLNSLTMTEDRDEIDVIAVNPGQGQLPIDDIFLCENIVWPQPFYNSTANWPPPGPGWYRYVNGWMEFRDTINSVFKIIFNKITTHTELKYIGILDKNSKNNAATIILYPRS